MNGVTEYVNYDRTMKEITTLLNSSTMARSGVTIALIAKVIVDTLGIEASDQLVGEIKYEIKKRTGNGKKNTSS